MRMSNDPPRVARASRPRLHLNSNAGETPAPRRGERCLSNLALPRLPRLADALAVVAQRAERVGAGDQGVADDDDVGPAAGGDQRVVDAERAAADGDVHFPRDG